MANDRDQELDPTTIAGREFSSSFRGYDPDEVRRFLRDLAEQYQTASALRPELERSKARLGDLQTANEALETRIVELETELARRSNLIESLTRRAERAEALSDPSAWDDTQIDALVGAETAHVLEAARTAAATIRSRAEADAAARLAVVEERQRTTEAEIAERRQTTLDELSALRAEAEKHAAELEESSEAAAAALEESSKAEAEERLAKADRIATELKRSTTKAASDLRAQSERAAAERKTSSEAEALRVTTEAAEAAEAVRQAADDEARRVTAEATELASAMRVEAEADLLAARERAREETQQMLAEANAAREKVLADLVRRRRAGRTQLDQIKAARDRMARSLALVQRDLGEAIEELVNSIPDAKAAMEQVGRTVDERPDDLSVEQLAAELDRDRMGRNAFDDAVAVGGSSSVPSHSHRVPGSGSSDDGQTIREQEGPIRVSDHSRTVVRRSAPSRRGSVVERALTGDGAGMTAGEEKMGVLFAHAPAGDDPDDEIEHIAGELDDAVELPVMIEERDKALARFGPNLRRQLKRALADDQSDILDRVRRARKAVTLDDLPPIERQVLTFLDAIADSVVGAASAGALAAGGSLDDHRVAEVIDRLARAIATPLRARIERAINETGGDKDEVLDPIRANYRDARTTEIPQLADAALIEAFAIGAYEALPDGSTVRWLVDPRHDPGPDCVANAAAGSLTKPATFPGGQHRPEAGCHCLVVAVS